MTAPGWLTGTCAVNGNTIQQTHYSEDDRADIVKSINQLVTGLNHQVIFFEYHPEKKLFTLIHHGGDTLSFSESQVKLETTKDKVNLFFENFINKFSHLTVPVKLTIIDAVYLRVRTTSGEVHDTRNLHPKFPGGRSTCNQGGYSLFDMTEEFIEDTFDNLTGRRLNL